MPNRRKLSKRFKSKYSSVRRAGDRYETVVPGTVELVLSGHPWGMAK